MASQNSIDNQIKAADFSIDAGNLNLPATTSVTQGVINIGGTRLMHAYGGISNLFVGIPSGNFSLTGTNNVGVGRATLQNLTNGGANTAVGLGTLQALQSGSNNMAIGYFALGNITATSDNVAIGANALINLASGNTNAVIGTNSGMNYTTSESNNILLNNNGVLGESNTTRIGASQTKCFVAGVNGVTVGSPSMVTVSASGQLGSATIPGSTNSNFQAYVTATITNVTGDGTAYSLICDSLKFDSASAYNTTNGHYTAPNSGIYMFGGVFYVDATTSLPTVTQLFATSITYNVSSEIASSTGTYYAYTWSSIAKVTAGEVIYPIITMSTGTKTKSVYGTTALTNVGTQFWGYQIA